MYAALLIREKGVGQSSPFALLLPPLERCFIQLSPKRQVHLDSVTRLAHKFTLLRRRYEPAYPCAGLEVEVEQFMLKLLLAYNLHDFGDIPVEIPKEFIYTEETAKRRQEIMEGDWISSAPYDADKFDPPIRGYLIHRSIMAALDVDEPGTPPLDSIIAQLGLQNMERRKLDRKEREQLEWNARVAYQHHEYYDGKGWPRGVKLDPRDPLMDGRNG